MLRLMALFILWVPFQVYAQTTYPSGATGCIARWNFTNPGTVTSLPDVSGNGNNGTTKNMSSATAFRTLPDKAMSFNGTNSGAEVAHSALLTPSSITIIALVKFGGFYSGPCQLSQIISKGFPHATSGNYGLGVGDNVYDGSCGAFSPNYMQQMNQYFNTSQTLIKGNYVQTGKWYFMATSYDGNTVKYYQKEMDTAVYHSTTLPIFNQSGLSTPIGTNSQNVSIGWHLNPSFPYWVNGQMDEVVLFNRVLTDAEVQSIYHYLWGGISIKTTDTSLCGVNKINVSYTVANPEHFYGSNVFSVQLSDAAGSFASPVTIGSTVSTTSGTISCTIPSSVAYGVGYRVRVIATNSPITSTDNGKNIIYEPSTTDVNIGNDTSICKGDSITLIASGAPNATYTWNTGSTLAYIKVKLGGTYSVIANDNSCKTYDTIVVTSKGPDVDLGKDTVICKNIPLSLHNRSHSFGYVYEWNTGGITQGIIVNNTGAYWLAANYNGCKLTDTIQITATDPPEVFLGNDTNICKGDVLELRNLAGNPPGAVLEWNTAVNTPAIKITNAGQYGLKVTANGCTGEHRINISYKPTPYVFIGNDTIICEKDSLLLLSTPQPNGTIYKWNTGATTDRIVANSKNSYSVKVTLNGCSDVDSIYIDHLQPLSIDLGIDTTICDEHQITIPQHASRSYNYSYKWSDGSSDTTFTVRGPGTYSVKLSDVCGSITDAIVVGSRNCTIWFPSAFSPNNDGRNDIAKILGDVAYITGYRLKIFNRWGENVYSTNDVYSGWDGKFDGKPVDAASYYYFIQCFYMGKFTILKGDISVIR